MARISLRSVIDDTFVRRFQGLASGSSQQNLANALRGQSSEVSISTGLRTGAQTFATSVQGLNTAISFFNTAKATLQNLDKLTDKLITLADRSSKSTTFTQERREANLEFQKLGDEFQRIISNAKLGEREFLTTEGIDEFLKVVGLDKDTSDSVKAIFDKFKVPIEDDNLASEEAQGERPSKIPPQAYSATAAFTVDYEKLFDDDVTIATRPNAYKVLGDLNALKEQIGSNIEGIDNGIEIIGKNMDLVRAAGFAFLELSDQLENETDATTVAEELRRMISRNAPAALSQAENLEALIVAALSLDTEKLGLSK